MLTLYLPGKWKKLDLRSSGGKVLHKEAWIAVILDTFLEVQGQNITAN